MDTYLPFVGFVQFPRQPHDLTDRVCPACFAERAGAICGSCGLDLASPLMGQLDAASMDATASLDRRLELIGRIRYASSAALVAEPAAPAAVAADFVPPSAAPPPVGTAPPVATVPPVTATPPATPAATPIAPRRHLGVQVILLIVGVSLLSVGAIFFLVYAFITFGLVWRSVIIVAVTIAAITGATLLKRRRLTATAEAIAALGIVFVYLDVFAVRANNLFGAADADGLMYWGIALLVAAIGFTIWHRFSGLRLPSIVAFTTFAPALALLVGGATTPLEDGVRVFASFAALALGGLIHPLGQHRVEKFIVGSCGIAGLVLAGLIAPFMVGEDWIPAVELGVVALIALAHVALIARVGTPVTIGRIAAGIGAVAAASVTLVVAVRVDDTGFLAFAPLVVAAVVAVALELVARRIASRPAGGFAMVAAWSAAAIGMLTLLVSAVFAVTPAVMLAASVSLRWIVAGGSAVTVAPEGAAALLALLVVVVLVSAAWAFSGALDDRLLVVVAAGCAILLLAPPLLGVLWAAVAAWLLVAAASVGALGVARARNWSTGIRITIAASGTVALGLAYTSSWASIDTWWYGSVGTVAILVAVRAVTASVAVRASTLGVASVLALVAAGAEGWHINERFAGGTGAGIESTHTVAILAVVLLIISALLARRLSIAETRVLFWISLVTSAWVVGFSLVGWVNSAILEQLVLPHFATILILGATLVAALVLWTLVRITEAFRIERIAASILLTPALTWSLDSLARALSPAAREVAFGISIAPIVAAAIIAACALAFATLRPATALRRTLEIGVALVAIPTTLIAIAGQVDATWLVLLIAAVAVLLAAISRDGLFASVSPRKHLGWLALALALGALWWQLTSSEVVDVELYVLPLAGALLLIALPVWRASDRRQGGAGPAPFIALAGLLVGILPIAAVSMTGPVTRTIVIAAVCAALLLAASLGVRTGALRPYLDSTAIAAAGGLIIAGFGRPIVLAQAGRGDDLQIDVWVASTFVVLVVAAIVQARVNDEKTRHRRIEASEVVVVLAMAGLVLIELAVIGEDGVGTARAMTVIVVLSALHVVGLLIARAPFVSIVGWIALAGASITAIAAIVVGAVDPFEWTTATLAAALLTVGAVTLARRTEEGSWPWLAPGILMLVLPSLLATFTLATDTPAPIFRLVGLGVVCIIAIAVGALARLQAPLILGSVVVLVHALRTFAPQLLAVYQLTEWWVWAVVGGAIILFIALTLEKRVRDLKSFGSRVSALR